jgi:hypothetical protein
MDSGRWPAELRQRLGDGGSAALDEVLDARENIVLTIATEQFESRLSDECARLRFELQTMSNELRSEMKVLRADLIAVISTTRADLIKWAFVFWAGQLAAVIALAAVLR